MVNWFRHLTELYLGCWNSHLTSQFIGDEELIDAPRLAIPPITFVAVPSNGSFGPGIRLLMDFFNNDWVMPREEDWNRKISVPNYLEEPTDWDEACKRSQGEYYFSEDYYYDWDEEDVEE
jgi:hypothetical protein